MKTLRDRIVLVLAGVNWLWIKLRRQKNLRLVLYYHSVPESQRKPFAVQMRYLAQTCDVVPLSQIVASDSCGQRNCVAITFDDAFANLRDNALPILRQLNLPCSIFVPTGHLGGLPGWDISNDHIDKTQPIMTVEQLRTLDESVDVYSHTVSHPRLTDLPDNRLTEEVTQSKLQLASMIGRPVDIISYPHGAYSEHVLRAVKNAGYRYGFTIEPQLVNGQNPLALPRFAVRPDDSMLRFRLITAGAYVVDYYLRLIKQRVTGLRA